jgi:hypothetical protein
MSLTNTCLDCHPNKDTFCDRCHNYMAVSPYCWDCHIVPEQDLEGKHHDDTMALEDETHGGGH